MEGKKNGISRGRIWIWIMCKKYIYMYNKRCEILFETCDGKMTGLNLLWITYRLFIIKTRYPREIFYPYVGKREENLYIWRDFVGFCFILCMVRWLGIKFIGLNLIFERNFFIIIRSKADYNHYCYLLSW